MRTGRSLLLLVCCGMLIPALFVSLSVRRAADEGVALKNGVVEGAVSYQADPARPWRYARYYVKQPKTGELAEAVVALRAKPVADVAREAQTVVIDQKNFQFAPETVVIRRGDAVKFTNEAPTTHNVQTSGEIANFNFNMPGGSEHVERFNRAGGIRQPAQIGCVFHSAMRAWIFVFDHPWFQMTAADGKFRLADVPPGEYDLEMVHPAGELRWRKRVEVQPGQTVRIDIRVSPDEKR
jgi:plastocyanin